MLAGNLLLAIIWVAMTGHLSVENFLAGFIFGYVVLLVSLRAIGPSPYFDKLGVILRFGAFYLVEVVRSNARVALDVISPRPRIQPGIVAIELEARTATEITLLANLISMTPGSLSIDVSDDHRVLYVHSMYVSDPEAFRESIRDDFERRVLDLMR